MSIEDLPERRPRHQVQLAAMVVQPDGSTMQTLVSDLSLEGCSVTGWFRIGEPINLRIERIGDVRGQVRWALAGKAGVRFEPARGGNEG